MSIMFNEICINEEMLPKYTYFINNLYTIVYGFKYSYEISIIYTQLYGFKYSYLILIHTQSYGLK